MPRDASGNYTLPLPDVASGSTIESDWANTTLADIAQELSDSLSRSGNGGLSQALQIVDGTASVPGLGFTSEANTGLRRVSAGLIEFGVLGDAYLRVGNAAGVQISTGATPSWQSVVATAAPSDNDILQYNATTENWEPGAVSTLSVPTSTLTGTLDDARVAESNVTQHEAALTITESQVSDLGSYLTDAPSNGTIYGRQNGSWVDAAGASSSSDVFRDILSSAFDSSGSPDVWLDTGLEITGLTWGQLYLFEAFFFLSSGDSNKKVELRLATSIGEIQWLVTDPDTVGGFHDSNEGIIYDYTWGDFPDVNRVVALRGYIETLTNAVNVKVQMKYETGTFGASLNGGSHIKMIQG